MRPPEVDLTIHKKFSPVQHIFFEKISYVGKDVMWLGLLIDFSLLVIPSVVSFTALIFNSTDSLYTDYYQTN